MGTVSKPPVCSRDSFRGTFQRFLRTLSLLGSVGVGTLLLSLPARADETYGGFVFSISQSESGAPKLKFGPTVRVDHDRLGASGSLQFELNESGRLHRVTLAPEVGVDASLAQITYGPRLTLEPGKESSISLLRTDDLFPRVEGVGFNDVMGAVKNLRASRRNPPPDLTEAEWDQLLALVNTGWVPTGVGEHSGQLVQSVVRAPHLTLRTEWMPKLEYTTPVYAPSSPSEASSPPARQPAGSEAAESAR